MLTTTKIATGDALTVLRLMPSESVQCCITSPPYWLLRDYGVEGQIGLEPAPDDYIQRLCEVFDEVKRVLQDDGTCWVVMGDTYFGSGKGAGCDRPMLENFRFRRKPKERGGTPKCLAQIPSRFGIEMCRRGWILRNRIIWLKSNSLPSKAKDRFTVNFDEIFFFTKNGQYYFEQQFEPYKPSRGNKKANMRSVWKIPVARRKKGHFAVYPEALIETPIKAGCPEGGIVLDPFCGSGTTGIVCERLGRSFLGIELNPEYVEIAKKRIRAARLPRAQG
jgi:DNA modification methylase